MSGGGGEQDGQDTRVRDLVTGSSVGRMRRGPSGTGVGDPRSGWAGLGSEDATGSRRDPAGAHGGTQSARWGGVWGAGVRLQVPGCPRRRALTRRPAVGAVSVASARRLQQLQQPLLVALAVAHGWPREVSGAQHSRPPARGRPWPVRSPGQVEWDGAQRLSPAGAAASPAPPRLSAPA